MSDGGRRAVVVPPSGRKVGRPTAEELRGRGDGRTLIDQTALHSFSELGFHGTSVRDIARAAGVSMSAMYHYYPSKQELLFALLQNAIGDYRANCDAALAEAGGDPLARFDALVAVTIEYRARHKIESNLVLGEARNLDQSFQEALLAPQKDATARFDEIIADGIAAGIFTTPFPDDARRAVQAMCNSIARWYDMDGPVHLDELIGRYQQLSRALVGYAGSIGAQAPRVGKAGRVSRSADKKRTPRPAG